MRTHGELENIWHMIRMLTVIFNYIGIIIRTKQILLGSIPRCHYRVLIKNSSGAVAQSKIIDTP